MDTLYENKDYNLKEIFNVLYKRIWVIICSAIILAVAAFFITDIMFLPQYDSSTRMYVVVRKDESTTITASELQLGSQVIKDYIILTSSKSVVEKVIQNLSLQTTYSNLVKSIKVTNPTDTRIIDIKVSYKDPLIAQKIADNLRDTASDFAKNIMNIDRISVVEKASLSSLPSSPNKTLNTQIGGLLGLLISISVILFLYFVDDRIKTSDDIEKYLGLSVLSVVPLRKSKK